MFNPFKSLFAARAAAKQVKIALTKPAASAVDIAMKQSFTKAEFTQGDEVQLSENVRIVCKGYWFWILVENNSKNTIFLTQENLPNYFLVPPHTSKRADFSDGALKVSILGDGIEAYLIDKACIYRVKA